MQESCIHCGLSSEGGNLWCQRVECSAANMVRVIRPGELFGEFEISTLLRVNRTASFYRAHRDGQPVLLKIANADQANAPGNGASADDYSNTLKQEVNLLQGLLIAGKTHAALPALLPPYANMTPSQLSNKGTAAYGRTTYQGKLHYYAVFAPLDGEFLRDRLNRHPQLPPKEAGWIVQQVCHLLVWLGTVVPGYVHGMLSPEIVFLRPDMDQIDRVVLLDMGMYSAQGLGAQPNTSTNIESYRGWLSKFVHPAYTPRELLYDYVPDVRTDVYGVSLMLYESLTGHPAYKFNTLTEPMVRTAIDSNDRAGFYRPDLADDIYRLVEGGLSDQSSRLASPREFGGALQAMFGAPPVERKPRPWWNPRYRNAILLGVLVVILAVIGLAVAFSLQSSAGFP